MAEKQRTHALRLLAKFQPPSFETEAINGTYQLTASEAVEAGLT